MTGSQIIVKNVKELLRVERLNLFSLVDLQAAEVASLFTSSNELIDFAKKYSLAADKLVDKQSKQIVSLFKTSEEFIKFAREDGWLAKNLIKHESDKIVSLFDLSAFRQLAKSDTAFNWGYFKRQRNICGYAKDLVNKQPEKIALMFENIEVLYSICSGRR